MATIASGIGRIIIEKGSVDWIFNAYYSGGIIGDDGTGAWIDGGGAETGATITWNGANPSMQNNTGVSRTINGLGVFYQFDTGLVDIARICHIPHTGVVLADTETIVYTSIQISFTSDDVT